MLAPSMPVSVPADAVGLDRAVLRTVAYSDVFDFPLRDVEVHRYVHGLRVPFEEVVAALRRCTAPGGPVAHADGHYMLAGRELLVPARRERAERAARLWPAAMRYGRAIAGLPFVRFVGVTGSLAWDNVPPNADVDYLVVTSPDRVWLVRWLIALLGRFARREGLLISPNHVVSTRALTVAERDLYIAYELSGLIPIAGLGMYRRLRRANAWTTGYLPNAAEVPHLPPGHHHREGGGNHRPITRLRDIGAAMLRARLGTAVDRVEMRYRVAKLQRFYRRVLMSGGIPPVTKYGVDSCRAYWGGHRPRALTRFAERLRSLEEGMA